MPRRHRARRDGSTRAAGPHRRAFARRRGGLPPRHPAGAAASGRDDGDRGSGRRLVRPGRRRVVVALLRRHQRPAPDLHRRLGRRPPRRLRRHGAAQRRLPRARGHRAPERHGHGCLGPDARSARADGGRRRRGPRRRRPRPVDRARLRTRHLRRRGGARGAVRPGRRRRRPVRHAHARRVRDGRRREARRGVGDLPCERCPRARLALSRGCRRRHTADRRPRGARGGCELRHISVHPGVHARRDGAAAAGVQRARRRRRRPPAPGPRRAGAPAPRLVPAHRRQAEPRARLADDGRHRPRTRHARRRGAVAASRGGTPWRRRHRRDARPPRRERPRGERGDGGARRAPFRPTPQSDRPLVRPPHRRRNP